MGFDKSPPGSLDKLQVTERAGSSTSLTVSFASWTQPSTDKLALVFIDFTVSGTGATTGEVAVDVDESGGTTADYTYNFTVETGLTGSITTSEQCIAFVPAGGQFQVRNVADPNVVNAINDARVVEL